LDDLNHFPGINRGATGSRTRLNGILRDGREVFLALQVSLDELSTT